MELAYVNCLLAGGAGGLSSWLLKNVVDLKYARKSQDSTSKYKTAYDFSAQFANPLTRYDVFVIGRGIIAGCVMVSAPAVNYKLWICMIIGAVGGLLQVGFTCILRKFKVDDPLQAFQTHGMPAVFSLIMIVLFDSSIGIFFTDWNDIGT